MRKRAFTLVELLVVIAIIALLVAILMPSLNQVRAMARKAVCGAQLKGHGTSLANYVSGSSRTASYPLSGNPGIDVPGWPDYGSGWSKFYGIMQANNVPGTTKTNCGTQAYCQEPDEIWKGALCPAENGPAIWKWAEANGTAWGTMGYKLYRNRSAIGYQWNASLRASTPNAVADPDCPCPCGLVGRWTSRLEDLDPAHGGHRNYWNCYWTDYVIHLPNDTNEYAAQATSPMQIDQPAQVAEGWDSYDMDSVPGCTSSFNTNWPIENMMPGWHHGPQSRGTRGWAVLNAKRHNGSPNILYADGHVAADANREITAADLDAPPSGSWDGARLTSWGDFDPTWGSFNHFLPTKQFRVPK